MTTNSLAERSHQDWLLDAAGAGDRHAFDQLLSPYRRELLAHCYRMLGSIHDADDALQNTLLRAWQGLPQFAQRSSVRTWLYKIATNACLALIERNGRRNRPIDLSDPGSKLSDPAGSGEETTWLEPYPYDDDDESSPTATIERRESVELAFIAAFQHLPANQRAVLLLRDVLGFSAKETAALLETTVASITSSLQRARVRIRERLPEQSQQANLRSLGDPRITALVTAYVEAWERSDASAILALLTEDATFSMPPYAAWYQGRKAIATFLEEAPLLASWRLVPTMASGQLAFGCYRLDDTGWTAHSVDVLTLRGDKVEHITAFLQPELLSRLGLPQRLPPLGTRRP